MAAGLLFALALGGLAAGCGVPVRPETPVQPATSPDDILRCDMSSERIDTFEGEDHVCGGLRLRELCVRRVALLHGVFNKLECGRQIDEERHAWNMALTARALFWRDAACDLSRSRSTPQEAPLESLRPGGKASFLVEGCGQARRYACDRLATNAYVAEKPDCAPAKAEVTAFAEALAETQALFRAATGCATAELDPERRSRGPLPAEGITELVLAGCGQSVPYTCALTPPPEAKHAGRCEAERPQPDALASARRHAAQVYAEAAGCARLGAQPRLTAQEVTVTRDARFSQVFLAEGCAARARVVCETGRLRDRGMSCKVAEAKALSDQAVRRAALAAAHRLHPGCTFTGATKWGGQPVTARMSVEGSCQGEPLITELACDADPVTSTPSCVVDEERERVGVEGRAQVLALFAKQTSCPRAQTKILQDRMQFVNGNYTRSIGVAGCKDSLELPCRLRNDVTDCTHGWR